jgi:hypothetical protein
MADPVARNWWRLGAAVDPIEEAAATEDRPKPPKNLSTTWEEAAAGKRCTKSSRERKMNLTLKTGSVYHVMNITCIHLKVKTLNIYMYRREKIYKKSWEKYNNKKG